MVVQVCCVRRQHHGAGPGVLQLPGACFLNAKAGLDEHQHHRLEHGQGLDPRSDAPQGAGTTG